MVLPLQSEEVMTQEKTEFTFLVQVHPALPLACRCLATATYKKRSLSIIEKRTPYSILKQEFYLIFLRLNSLPNTSCECSADKWTNDENPQISQS